MVGYIDERRETFRNLPREVRRPDRQRDAGRDPRIPRPQVRPQRGSKQDGHPDGSRQTADRVLDLEADAEREAEVDPVPGAMLLDQTQKPVERDHPGHLIERHGLIDPVRAEEVGCRDGDQ